MIVVAILALLAALVIPQYRDYQAKVHVKAAIDRMQNCQKSLSKVSKGTDNITTIPECYEIISLSALSVQVTDESLQQMYVGAYDQVYEEWKKARDDQIMRGINNCKQKFSDPDEYSGCILEIEKPPMLPAPVVPELRAQRTINTY